MRIIYIADDGKEFEDAFQCEDYEWKLKHPHLQEVKIYDECGKLLEDVCAEKTYYTASKIIAPTMESVQDLREWADYTGYSLYANINSPGTWEFYEEKEKFVKRGEV